MTDCMMTVARGCGMAGMESLEQGSVHMVCADLPSGETRAKTDRPISLERFWSAARHCLRADGNVVLMASSLRFASKVLGSNPASFKYDLVWHKSMATGFYNARRRPLRAHEFVLIFGTPDSYYDPQMTESGKPMRSWVKGAKGHGENYGRGHRVMTRAGAMDRYPRSVLEHPVVGTSAKGRTHPQQKPHGLLERLVRAYSPHYGLVVDPCAGSGSCGVAARVAGRRFLGWDLYFEPPQQELFA